MMDVRLKSESFEFDGRTFVLRANMNVLAEVQEAHGGRFSEALDLRASVRSSLEFLAAMMNDFAEEQGWPERYEPRAVGRQLPAGKIDLLTEKVMGLVFDALRGDASEPGSGDAPGEEPGPFPAEASEALISPGI